MIKFLKKHPISIFIIVIIIWVITYFIMQQIDKPNEVGDSYGALNTLFSGLAFAGIIISIFMQNQELAMQRDEIILNRDELIETRKEISNQAVQMTRQAENLKISAKLSALSTLLSYYLEEQRKNPMNRRINQDKIDKLIHEIKQINEIKIL